MMFSGGHDGEALDERGAGAAARGFGSFTVIFLCFSIFFLGAFLRNYLAQLASVAGG